MLFNTSKSMKFTPDFSLEGQHIELVQKVRLLGLQITSDLRWRSNTSTIVTKANKRLWILRRLRNYGASSSSLIDVYKKQIRSVLEFGVPVWQGRITLEEKSDIERVKRCATHIILGDQYHSYQDDLKALNLETLEVRRTRLCLNFALKAESHPKFRNWFIPATKAYDTRNKKKYKDVSAKHARFSKSPLGYLTRLLNMHYVNKH